ncbi:hypothetical protein GDO78_002784 [Eleutherodactylus coqui]|uniref:Uncharacterized protein n=1 Tax=Eleutherodactylus coqui TaxID=57060 RepID=A0A8J6K3N1_ELECQ|nr:hypothetical protein GDO78_002784 [Eleutherodactylus coqui]
MMATNWSALANPFFGGSSPIGTRPTQYKNHMETKKKKTIYFCEHTGFKNNLHVPRCCQRQYMDSVEPT